MRGAGFSQWRRRLAGGCALVLLASAAACSGGGGGSSSESSTAKSGDTCALLGRLDSIAKNLEQTDVGNPETFRTAVDTALKDLAQALDSLADVVPTDARRDVTTMSQLVEQRKYDEALQYRFRLDDLAATECPEGTG